MTTFGYGWCDTCGQPIEWVRTANAWIHGWTNMPRPSKIADPTSAHEIIPALEKVDA